jgi:hypothetical protein
MGLPGHIYLEQETGPEALSSFGAMSVTVTVHMYRKQVITKIQG